MKLNENEEQLIKVDWAAFLKSAEQYNQPDVELETHVRGVEIFLDFLRTTLLNKLSLGPTDFEFQENGVLLKTRRMGMNVPCKILLPWHSGELGWKLRVHFVKQKVFPLPGHLPHHFDQQTQPPELVQKQHDKRLVTIDGVSLSIEDTVDGSDTPTLFSGFIPLLDATGDGKVVVFGTIDYGLMSAFSNNEAAKPFRDHPILKDIAVDIALRPLINVRRGTVRIDAQAAVFKHPDGSLLDPILSAKLSDSIKASVKYANASSS